MGVLNGARSGIWLGWTAQVSLDSKAAQKTFKWFWFKRIQ